MLALRDPKWCLRCERPVPYAWHWTLLGKCRDLCRHRVPVGDDLAPQRTPACMISLSHELSVVAYHGQNPAHDDC
ncbi:hypothetical protein PAXRUDRAFT_824643 [Paxillus rubicundulus Ve08.2h10]|uniref:Uncharacterized protein n=1 Tax=Paxillus rubicundulus Ve08.2h10 TaxID=930991 RepID=A0A0D0DU56_9AGAM|nr:hypothetical protein PAXRUDRAFT_824643 [Paxillus rubicundulus Ve08.2h10]